MPETNISRELALQEAIRAQMAPIVQAATRTATLLQNSGMDKNQIRNVLNVAEESESVAVVANFIRYQIGRSGTGKAWQHSGFGLRVIEDITEQDQPVRKALDAVEKRVAGRIGEDAVTDDLRRQAHVDLMRYYLGYLNRAFIFGSNDDIKGSWRELKRAVEATNV